MKLTAQEFGRMVDGACITATMSFSSQVDLAEAAKKYEFKQVYGFASYYDYLLKRIKRN